MLQEFMKRCRIASIIDGRLCTDGRTACKNQCPLRTVQAAHQYNKGIVRILLAGLRSGRIYASFAGSRMKIDNHLVPAILSGRYTPENKFLRSWNLPL